MADVTDLLTTLDNLALDVVADSAQKMVDQSNLAAPYQTGALSEAGRVDGVSGGGGYAEATVSNPTEYASYQDQGTGGSTGNPWLTFQIGGQWVRVHQTAPVPATRFWEDTMNDEVWAETVQGSLETFST